MKLHTYVLCLLVVLLPLGASAHPGNTASDGCHYCRTRCDYWGEAWGMRHCHGGYEAPSTPSCPTNSYRSGNSCTCNYGYAPSLDRQRCIKIPANAHEGNGITDVWECDNGYIESGNTCIKDPTVQVDNTPKETETSEAPKEAISDGDLAKIEEYVKQVERENADNVVGSFLSYLAVAIGGIIAYRKFKK